MKLLTLRLSDYRRFAGAHEIDLSEQLVALVGPNESGKSSILHALRLLGSREFPATADVTRGHTGRATISARFLLEDDERAVLSHIHGGSAVTHLWIDASSGAEKQIWKPEPRPTRDLAPRRRCGDLFVQLEGDPALDAAFSDPEVPWDPDLLVRVSETLGSDVETLDEDAVTTFENLADRVRRVTYPPADRDDLKFAEPSIIQTRADAREAAASALVDLAQIERQPTPTRQVLNALDPFYPGIIFFEEADRDLRSDYQVAVAVQERPAALENLCAVAKLELGDVAAAIDSGRIPHVEKLIEDANAELKRVFSEVWKQSGVYPRFSAPLDGTLRVFIATEGDASYSFPHERSDGLRWFIALHAFLASTAADAPVLLVDEAETHLHYDAQADLIDALMAQQVAPKVVYTTHSVGCLPPDLGRGIRAVLPAKDAERSEIANSYWSIDPAGEERVGYTPLLFGMGARLLSLTVPRWAVVAEGPSDAILLPSLLREASKLDSLGYRVVGGLSELARARLSALPTHGGSVVCLADGDPPGLTRLAQVEKAGMQKGRLFHLGDVQPDCTLEDLVAAEVLAEAVNLELQTWGIASYRVDPGTFPSVGRWNRLMDIANTGGEDLSRLSKTRVAQRVVDAQRMSSGAAAGGVVDATLASSLAKLQKRIRKTLGL